MNSKLEVRNEAVRLALNIEGVTSENLIEISDKIAKFILGDSGMPETYDNNAYLKELMDKINLKPTAYESTIIKETEEAQSN